MFMSTISELEIERHALKIPPDARLRIAAKLLSSVPLTARSSLSEEQALDLAQKRAAEMDSGVVPGLEFHEEMERIRSSLPR